MKPIFISFLLITAMLFSPVLTVSGKTLYLSQFRIDGFLYQYDTTNETATVTGLGYATYPYLIPKKTVPKLDLPPGERYSVVAIADSAFFKPKDALLGILQIPSSVATIGKSAFEGNDLKTVTIDSVFSIGEYAFKNCKSLTEIYSFNPEPPACAANAFEGIPSGCNLYVPFGSAQKYREAEGWSRFAYIGERVSAVVDGIKYRTLDEETAEAVPDLMYYIMGTIGEHLQFPKSVTIGGREFKVTQIGEAAFWKCLEPETITIHSGIAVIGVGAFGGCFIKSLTIEEGVQSISDGAFSWCEWLTSVTLPGSIEYIGGAFNGCLSLNTAVLNNGIKHIGNELFMWCLRLSSVSLPEGIKNIGTRSFAYCDSLKELTIGEGIAYISDQLFYDSGLERLYLPESVQSIGNEAFAYCRKLSEITCMNPDPPALANETFKDFAPSGCRLIVPAEAVEAYKNAEGWKEFLISDGTDIEKTAMPELTIKRNDTGCSIEGAALGETIFIYDNAGLLLQSIPVHSDRIEIELKAPGVYIIRYKGKGITVAF